MSIQQKIAEYNPDIVCIDGVYLLDVEGGSKTERACNTTNQLKMLAKSNKIPIIGSTQMGRQGKWSSKDGSDRLAKIQWSDSYGQDADIIVELGFPPVCQQEKVMKHRVIKNREGVAGFEWNSRWNLTKMEFHEYREGESCPVSSDDFKASVAKEDSEQIAKNVWTGN